MTVIENRGSFMRGFLAVVAGCVVLLTPDVFAQSSKPAQLECEALSTPLGMDTTKPLLSWKIQDSHQGARQTAYEIQVASTEKILASGKSDIWDSGRVESDNSIAAQYGGPALEPSKRYYWRVLAWDENGKELAPSEPSWWETGTSRQENWKAQWIGYEVPEERSVREAGAEWITNVKVDSAKTGRQSRTRFPISFRFGETGSARRLVCDRRGFRRRVDKWKAGVAIGTASAMGTISVEDLHRPQRLQRFAKRAEHISSRDRTLRREANSKSNSDERRPVRRSSRWQRRSFQKLCEWLASNVKRERELASPNLVMRRGAMPFSNSVQPSGRAQRTGKSVADGPCQIFAPHIRNYTNRRLRANLRNCNGCIQTFHQRAARGRRNPLAGMDGLPATRGVPGIRRHCESEIREKRDCRAASPWLVFHAVAVVSAGE